MNDCCKEHLETVATAIEASASRLSWWFKLLGASYYVRHVAGVVRAYKKEP